MTDRELLELAAKAAGIVVTRSRLEDPLSLDMLVEESARNPYQKAGPWNPLTDDGDALRLAVKLGLDIDYRPGYVGIHTGRGQYIATCPHDEHDEHGSAATRRAIVRAAAEIGRTR